MRAIMNLYIKDFLTSFSFTATCFIARKKGKVTNYKLYAHSNNTILSVTEKKYIIGKEK